MKYLVLANIKLKFLCLGGGEEKISPTPLYERGALKQFSVPHPNSCLCPLLPVTVQRFALQTALLQPV